MNNGLEGVVAADTVLSHTDGDTGTWISVARFENSKRKILDREIGPGRDLDK